MQRTGFAVGLIVCPLLLAGCSHEELPTTHLSEVTVTAESDAVHLAFDKPPVIKKIVKPQYPEIAREDGIEGKVILTIIVNEEGKVAEAKVLLAEPADIFNESALNAVMRYEFDPAEKDGEPIKVQVGQTIVFKLARRESP